MNTIEQLNSHERIPWTRLHESQYEWVLGEIESARTQFINERNREKPFHYGYSARLNILTAAHALDHIATFPQYQYAVWRGGLVSPDNGNPERPHDRIDGYYVAAPGRARVSGGFRATEVAPIVALHAIARELRSVHEFCDMEAHLNQLSNDLHAHAGKTESFVQIPLGGNLSLVVSIRQDGIKEPLSLAMTHGEYDFDIVVTNADGRHRERLIHDLMDQFKPEEVLTRLIRHSPDALGMLRSEEEPTHVQRLNEKATQSEIEAAFMMLANTYTKKSDEIILDDGKHRIRQVVYTETDDMFSLYFAFFEGDQNIGTRPLFYFILPSQKTLHAYRYERYLRTDNKLPQYLAQEIMLSPKPLRWANRDGCIFTGNHPFLVQAPFIADLRVPVDPDRMRNMIEQSIVTPPQVLAHIRACDRTNTYTDTKILVPDSWIRFQRVGTLLWEINFFPDGDRMNYTISVSHTS